ncbi:MAG: hypothetical protein R3182_03590 [Draconibacterium sp.]|nr:hypothetical protein [Draconibacterium sp.]
MKKMLFTMMAICILFSAFGKKKVNFEKEKAAILTTIEEEKRGYAEKNMPKMKLHVVDDPTYSWLYADANGHLFNHGFSNQEKLVKGWWENSESEFPKQKITTNFVELKIFPETAWAVIDVVWAQVENGKIVHERKGMETLFFEKVKGKWKIACHTVLDKSSYNN